MANILGLAGGQPQKQTRFAPIYTGRWSSGLWTNRSPMRDAVTTRIVEKFYGAAGDALIAGSNTEITNRLTLARRPGNSVYDSNSYSAIDCFYDFRLFGPTTEQINVMVDQAAALYSLYAGTKSLVWTKANGAGQSYMQSVGNSLYWGDGVSNKKWLQTLQTWVSRGQWNTATTPFLTTFFIDPNGNIQQLTATVIPVADIQVENNTLTVTSSETIEGILSAGMNVEFPSTMNATFLEYQTVTIEGVNGSYFTASFVNDDYTGTESGVYMTETTGGANPTSGSTQPTWSTTVPSAANGYRGGVTTDGMVAWTNRGNPVMNWGIVAPIVAPAPTIGSSNIAWEANTYYSGPGVVVDSNGNLQQVTVPGKTGATQPTWGTNLNGTTSDGSVQWLMIQTASSMVWAPYTQYNGVNVFSITSAANASGGTTVYTGSSSSSGTSGASDAFAGMVFVVAGFDETTDASVNNGVFLCTASTATTLTLRNPNGIAETQQATATSNPSYVIGNAYGTNCLYYPAGFNQIRLTGDVSAYVYPGQAGTQAQPNYVGCFEAVHPLSLSTASSSVTNLNSLDLTYGTITSNNEQMKWATVNGSGAVTGYTNPFPDNTSEYALVILANLDVPIAGQYSFTITHHDGLFWGIGNGATLVSGTNNNPSGQTLTATQGYPVLGGTNRGLENGAVWTDTFVVNFPTPGTYPIEINFAYWYHEYLQMQVQCQGQNLANGTPESSASAPIWPSWTTQYAPAYPSVSETNGVIEWYNVGPTSDFSWYASTNYTLPESTIIDPNSNYESAYRTGVTGTMAPTFTTAINALTLDNPNLVWINDGPATTVTNGTMYAATGWQYCLALVNTLDNTVSNCTNLSQTTGQVIGANGILFQPGECLDVNNIDPQCDYVAIFRTTDGQAVPFLIPGTFTTYTLPLSVYLTDGYTDTTPDSGLNNLIEAPIEDQNTPPGAGAQNLTYHLNRIFFSIGNTVYWTSGADTPVGNGVNGVSPLNFSELPSLVTRIVPTAVGAMVFTVSDVYVIQGSGTASSPIQASTILMQGVGLGNYNALDVNGSTIGFFTTDNQFCIIDPSSGVSYAGFPIGDQFRLNNGTPGQSWNSSNIYVAWYVNGEDQGWFVSDGQFGWYKLIPTPAPETGYTWSPFATLVGGCKAVQSIEVTPGVHKLLVGPVTTGSILARDLTTWQDNGQNYTANAVIGSAVLAQPGQVATVSFVTTESVRVGTPLTLGLLLDEALPYYTGPFEILKVWENDPPELKPSQSFYAQRFYLNELEDEAVCRHMQIKVQWAAENAQNELSALTVFGAYFQEK